MEHPTKKISILNLEKLEGENPNKYTEKTMEALRTSFKTYGKIVDQIIVDDGELDPELKKKLNGRYQIINGEHSVKVLIENGIESTDVKIVRCKDDIERRIIRQIANKTHGTHDPTDGFLDFEHVDVTVQRLEHYANTKAVRIPASPTNPPQNNTNTVNPTKKQGKPQHA